MSESNKRYHKKTIIDNPEKREQRNAQNRNRYFETKIQPQLAAFAGKPKPAEPSPVTTTELKKYKQYKHMDFNTFLRQHELQKCQKIYHKEESKFEGASECGCKEKCCRSCINVMSARDCDTYTCSISQGCGNRWNDVSKSWAINSCFFALEDKMGTGLKAFTSIEKEAIVGPYVGTIVTTKPRKEDVNHYLSDLVSGVWINAEKKGNATRFINHCCQPNCEMVKREFSGQVTNWIIATQSIKSGEFLSINYNKKAFYSMDGKEIPCQCKACREME